MNLNNKIERLFKRLPRDVVIRRNMACVVCQTACVVICFFISRPAHYLNHLLTVCWDEKRLIQLDFILADWCSLLFHAFRLAFQRRLLLVRFSSCTLCRSARVSILYCCLNGIRGDWKRETGKPGTVKIQGWKTRNWKDRHQIAGVEIARLENPAPTRKSGKRRNKLYAQPMG